MFQRIFNKAQKKKPLPIILINSLDNDKTRGDMHGYAGIAAHLAQKMNAKIVTTDNAVLAAQYPDAGTPEKALRCYLDAYGAPEIYFGKCDETTRAYLYENGTRHIEATLNETFSRLYEKNTDLVPHHITQARLKQATENLEADYPDLKQPLITVFIANVVEQTADMLSKKLAGISRSMVSEVLATGKTVYILQDEDSFKNALARGQAKRFDSHPEKTPLATETIPPVDVTQKIAEDVYERYKASPKRTSFISRVIRPF